MKQYEIVVNVTPQEDKPTDNGDWMTAPTFFVLGAISMMLLLLP